MVVTELNSSSHSTTDKQAIIVSNLFPSVKKSLCIACHNVNRLVTSNNTDTLDQIKIILESDNTTLDIYGVCESFLTKSVSDEFLNIDGYQIVRKDRSYSHGGGLLLYIANHFQFKRRFDLESNIPCQIEIIWIELNLPGKSFLLCLY